MKKRILYVEDEASLARIVRETLERKGFQVLHLKDGSKLLESIPGFLPDALVLDVMLPGVDGFTLGSAVRELYSRLPIIFLTAKGQTQDVLTGFSSGGTDYLRKPFSMEELMVRLETQIRLYRSEPVSNDSLPEEVELGKLRFYPGRFELAGEGGKIQKLSNREAQLLGLLARHRNQSIDRRRILQEIWGDDTFYNSRNLDVYVRRLRDYLSADGRLELITLKGQGYHFSVPESGGEI